MGRVPIDYEYKSVEEHLARKFAYYNFENKAYVYPTRKPPRVVCEENKKFKLPKINKSDDEDS